jgi:hypothetical protein
MRRAILHVHRNKASSGDDRAPDLRATVAATTFQSRAPLWCQFFHPPSEPPNRSLAYHPDDDDPEAQTLTFVREAPRQPEEVRRIRYRRKPVAGYAS